MKNILSSLGFSRKKEKPKAISLHPDCMKKHGSLVLSWLSGSKISVLNPNTNAFEYCPNPIFDPELTYAYYGTTTDGSNVLYPPVAPAPAPAPVPRPPFVPTVSAPVKPIVVNTLFNRGDIYKSVHGFTYLVLGDKRKIIPNYTPALDPDSGPIVVMRIDSGIKMAVSCRKADGSRKDGSLKYSLKIREKTTSLPPVASDLLLMSRAGSPDVYLDNRTGEVKLR